MEKMPHHKDSLLVNKHGTLASQFITAELLMALEKLNVLEYIAESSGVTASEISNKFRLELKLIDAVFNFFAVEEIFSKNNSGEFCFVIDYPSIKMMANFLLAYRSTFEQAGELLEGSRVYGKDVKRDATRLGFNTLWTIQHLTNRLEDLGVHKVFDVGCGHGLFLLTLAEHIPSFIGVGIDIDKPTLKLAESRIKASHHQSSLHVFRADAKKPSSFPKEASEMEALIISGILHEFGNSLNLTSLLQLYKEKFPTQILFLVEIDTPNWDNLIEEEKGPDKWRAANYLLTHHLSDQGLPRSESEWSQTLKDAGWEVQRINRVPLRTTIFECI